jgi:hypothetical protein
MDNADGGSSLSIGAQVPSTLDLTGQVDILENAKAFEGTFSSVSKGICDGKEVSRSPIQELR